MAPMPYQLPDAARTRPRRCVTTASGIDAEDVAALCLIEPTETISCADLTDLPTSSTRPAPSSSA